MKEIVNYKNIHEMIKVAIDKYPNNKAYQWILNDHGDTESVTWARFYDQIKMVSKSLMKLGIKKGDKAVILSFTCYQWVLCDLGITTMGACTVGVYHSNLSKDCEYIIKHSGSKIIFVEDEEQLEKIIAIKKNIPLVKKVILFKGSYSGKLKKWIISFDEFIKLGKSLSDKYYLYAATKITPKDLATIVYTSGTTGVPKGAMLTHDNLIFTSQLVATNMPVNEKDETFLFLPLAHIFGRVDIYASIIINATLTFCRKIETVMADMQIATPHWFPAVPRIFDKVYSRVKLNAEQKGGLVLMIFRFALNIGYKISDLKIEKKPIPFYLKYIYSVVYKLIFSKLHKALGGKIRFLVSGAAPLSSEVARFFHAAGILILEGYGMTENTSFTTATKIDNYKFGTVGFPAPGIEQHIADDGEILYRGRNVMKGYYKMPKETAQVLKKGWLHTGDIGIVDENGFLIITDRKKDIIITSGGKNIAPAPIENMLTSSQYIGQACVIGDRQKYLTALITLDVDRVKEFAEKNNISYNKIDELNNHPEVLKQIEKDIFKINDKLARFERIKKFTILSEFTIDNGMMTPTFKLKKNIILEKNKKVIDSMYIED